MTSCFFRYNFWGVNNMYLGLRGGGILYPWRKGVFALHVPGTHSTCASCYARMFECCENYEWNQQPTVDLLARDDSRLAVDSYWIADCCGWMANTTKTRTNIPIYDYMIPITK